MDSEQTNCLDPCSKKHWNENNQDKTIIKSKKWLTEYNLKDTKSSISFSHKQIA
jgi:hypothetical protein